MVSFVTIVFFSNSFMVSFGSYAILYVHFFPHLAVIFYTNDSFMIHLLSDDSFTIHFPHMRSFFCSVLESVL